MDPRPASTRSAPRSRGFFWQGVLILLPVVVLATIGFISIRQDKVLAEREAAERAQELADQCAESLWAALTNASALDRELAFQVDASGELIFPPPAAPLPAPAPFPAKELTAEQSRLWESISSLSASNDVYVTASREFLSTHPPARFDAAARFRLAGTLAAIGDAAGRDSFSDLSRLPPDVVGETGLPLAPLARVKWIELMEPSSPLREGAVLALRSAALSNPSPITPYLLTRAGELQPAPAESARWRREWERQELLRHLYSRARRQIRSTTNPVPPPLPRFIWFSTDELEETRWLATRAEIGPQGATYPCRPALDEQLLPPSEAVRGAPRLIGRSHWVNTRLNLLHNFSVTNAPLDPFPAAVTAAHHRLPGHFGLSLDVAGRTLIGSNQLAALVLVGGGKGGGRYWKNVVSSSPPPLIGQAVRLDEGTVVLRVGIHLVGPELLYDRQQTRSRLFSLLILAAAGASVIGFFSARRAYLRQQLLGEMKSNFVSSVSHELRAPIASVRLMAENLERGKVSDPARQRDYFRFIVQECRRLGALIENVLDFSRIEQGRKQYDFEPTDVVALVQQTVRLMEPAASEKHVTLRVELPPAWSAGLRPGVLDGSGTDERAEPELGAPLLDAPAIQQALINLLDNAIKHSPSGATVEVGLTAPAPPTTTEASHVSRFSFYVQDHGPGIPAGEHDKIFERFYRCGSELRRETQGVGIGLSIVRHIAEAHGGCVRVESEPGQGCRFVMELPLQKTPNSKLQTPGKLQTPKAK